jgi:stage II sporulation protein GA (sporulation sigma-E factor processing peptidase)
MILYADVLFALNALIDYLLLLLSARAAGEPLRRVRFLLAAAVGGVYAVLIFVPGFSFLNGDRYKVMSAGLMLLIAYGTTKHLWKQSLIFLALTCALGGGILAIGMMDTASLSLGRGVVYSVPDLKMVLLSGAGCYACLNLVMPRLLRHTSARGELRQIEFELNDRRMSFTAFMDTGNTLADPATGTPVPVAEGASAAALFPPEHRPGEADLLDPVSGMKRLNTGAWRGRFRLIPYRAVGVERGFLLAVRVDRMIMGEKQREGAVVALSPTPVSDGGGYRVLMGGW